jgi:hypothetical protein
MMHGNRAALEGRFLGEPLRLPELLKPAAKLLSCSASKLLAKSQSKTAAIEHSARLFASLLQKGAQCSIHRVFGRECLCDVRLQDDDICALTPPVWCQSGPRSSALRFGCQQPAKSESHSQGWKSLMFRCSVTLTVGRSVWKSLLQKSLGGKFPGIPAPFPEFVPKFADFGQNLQKSVLRTKKFAEKFAGAGKNRQSAVG